MPEPLQLSASRVGFRLQSWLSRRLSRSHGVLWIFLTVFAVVSLATRVGLLVVSANERITEQLAANGVLAIIGPDAVYGTDARLGVATDRALSDARAWIGERR